MDFETQAIEWKTAWRDEYLKWICGFANAQGGILEIGKNDSGVVVGLKDPRKLLEDIPNKINNAMAILADVDLKSEGGLRYIAITVKPYPYPISYHGKYYYRSGSTNRELSGNALDEFILKKQGKTWDGVPVPRLKTSDLDIAAFRVFRKKALSSHRLTEEDLAISDEALIDSLVLTDGNYLKRAAVLLFHENPEKWIPGAYVKIGYFETGADLLYQDEIHGPVIIMPDKVIDTIYLKYFKGIISYDGIQRVETYPVPRAACREAVLNAIVHRDYSTGIPIQVKVFPDEVVIYNDGGLPEGWTVADLLAKHRSRPRNPNIANVFFRSGMIETWGRGIEKIETACKEAGRLPPVFVATASEVQVSFTMRDNGVNDRQLSMPNGIDAGIENGIDGGIENSAGKIISVLSTDPRATQKKLAAEAGLSVRTVARAMKRLREAGVLRRVGTDRSGYWEIIKKV